MYVMYVYKTNFTSSQKYKLTKRLTYKFAQKYFPSEKQPINLFTQF